MKRTTWAVSDFDTETMEPTDRHLAIYVDGKCVARIGFDAFPALIADLATAIRNFVWKPK